MNRPRWLRIPRFIRPVAGRDGFWWVVGVVAILAIGVVFSWLFWEELRDDEESLSTTIRNIGLVGGGIIAIVLAVWRSLVAQKQAEAALRQADTALRQADTAQQGLLNERYQQGAEMLGDNVLSVRLGGIYALQSLAEEHPEQYHVQIMRLFCAFVRRPTEDQVLESRRIQGESIPPLREDVEAIMTAIGARKRTGIALEREAEFRLDFTDADLRRMTLLKADLSRAILTGVNMSVSILLESNLAGALLMKANVSTTVLLGANLCGTFLGESGPSSADPWFDLREAVLGELGFQETSHQRANLSGALLQGAKNLTQAQLDGACADPKKPPRLDGALDVETGKPLVWRGKPLDDEA